MASRAQISTASQESITRVRRWIRISPPIEGWWPWGILPLLAFVLLLLFAFLYFAASVIEADVARRAEQQLLAAGFDWARVTANGQEVEVRGTSPQPVSEELIAAVARSTECETLFGLMHCPTKVHVDIDTLPAPVSDPPPERPAPPENEPPPLEPPPRGHDFTFEVVGDEIILRGEVPDETTRERLVQTAQVGFKSVVDELHMTGATPTASYPQASQIGLEALSLLVTGKATWIEGKLGVSGVVADGRDTELKHILNVLGTSQLGELKLLAEEAALACDEDFATILDRSKIRFTTGSAEIRPVSMALLKELAEVAKQCPVTLQIEGHTDSAGKAEFNRQLSLRRANAVKRALGVLGVAESNLVPLGFGETKPLATNTTLSGRAKNRRIEIRIRR